MGREFFYRRERGEREDFFLRPRIFLQGDGKQIFSGGQGFFTGRGGGFKSRLCLKFGGKGRGEENIFSWGPKDFFTGMMEGFKSRLCLRFGGKRGVEEEFFFGPRIFLHEREEVSKVVFA